jgi:hypothetical protein
MLDSFECTGGDNKLFEKSLSLISFCFESSHRTEQRCNEYDPLLGYANSCTYIIQ